MGLILHEISPSPPVRAVKLCLAELGLQAEYKLVNLIEMEHLTEDFVKINPQHTVPVLEDGDFIIWDSHAINAYLVSVYGKNDALYPKDPKTRAVIDQRLHFDSGVLFSALRNVGVKFFYKKQKINEEDLEKIREGFDFLEKFLEGKQFVAGDSFNIADFSVYTTTTALAVIVPLKEKYPNISKYFNVCKSLFKGANADKEGLQACTALYEKELARP